MPLPTKQPEKAVLISIVVTSLVWAFVANEMQDAACRRSNEIIYFQLVEHNLWEASNIGIDLSEHGSDWKDSAEWQNHAKTDGWSSKVRYTMNALMLGAESC